MKIYSKVNEDKLMQIDGLGVEKVEPKGQFEKLRFSGKVTIILYNSGKLVLNGSPEEIEKMDKLFKEAGVVEQEIIKEKKDYTPIKEEGFCIGCDETLKGDTFGGLILAVVRADDEKRLKLKMLGVDDSKKISDKKILEMAPKIKEILENDYIVQVIQPIEYNTMTRSQNVTQILNLMYSTLIDGVKEDEEDTIYIDKYPGAKVKQEATYIEKGESRVIEIAAASILAREEAILMFEKLSNTLGFEVPKGSTHVKEAIEKLKKTGHNIERFVKTSFKNVQ